MKIIKGVGYFITQEQLDAKYKHKNGYVIPLLRDLKEVKLTAEQLEEIRKALAQKKTKKVKVCKKYNISLYKLNQALLK